MPTADVVVVGAGIIGCSIAYQLAKQGAGRIVVLEKNEIGRGATADAAGGIRLQFSTPINILLSQHSLETWTHFTELFGVDISFHQNGYLFLLTSDTEVEAFQSNMRQQQQLGVPVNWVSRDQVRELNPAIRVDDVLGGTFCPLDGWADPYSATMGYAQAARRLGVEFIEDSEVVGISSASGGVTGLSTQYDHYDTASVVLAAGAHSPQIAAMTGVQLPILPYRRMSFVTDPFDLVPSTVPMTIDFTSSLYFHPESRGFLFGMSNPNEPAGFDRSVDDDWMVQTIEALCLRAPVFEDARVIRGWGGLYDITPDDNPLLGPVENVENLYVAAGFSGHGFMQGPAIGTCIAEMVLGQDRTTIDVTQFSPTRFQHGVLLQEHNVI